MIIENKAIWLAEGSAVSAKTGIPLSYDVCLRNIDIRVSTNNEMHLTHLMMSTEDLILLKNAIENELGDNALSTKTEVKK